MRNQTSAEQAARKSIENEEIQTRQELMMMHNRRTESRDQFSASLFSQGPTPTVSAIGDTPIVSSPTMQFPHSASATAEPATPVVPSNTPNFPNAARLMRHNHAMHGHYPVATDGNDAYEARLHVDSDSETNDNDSVGSEVFEVLSFEAPNNSLASTITSLYLSLATQKSNSSSEAATPASTTPSLGN